MAIKTLTFNYTGSVQTFVAPPGVTRIKFECWGAAGGLDGSAARPYGGYCWGEYNIQNFNTFYIYVGGIGASGASGSGGGWNGGGNAGPYGSSGGGGGASDIRLVGGAWNDFNSLSARLIVAGGAGGDGNGPVGGVGGGLVGGTGTGGSGGGTQTSGGVGNNGTGGFGFGANHTGDGGGGGGGWYGGGAGNGDAGGGGGSSYYGSLLNAGTTAGVNPGTGGNGLVKITYEEDVNAYVLKKDGFYYIIRKDYFNKDTRKFTPVDISTVYYELMFDNSSMPFLNINKPFTIDSVTYTPSECIDYTQYKLAVVSLNNLTKLGAIYTPTSKALAKTNIKVKEQYKITPALYNYGPFLDITSTDKSKIDYFLDYGQAKSYKNASILNTDMISDSFYANFKLDKPESLISQVSLYNKYNYRKLQENQMDVYDNFKDSAFVVFHDDYDLMLVNRIAKKELINYIETLDKF
jgi:hypothetical protein